MREIVEEQTAQAGVKRHRVLTLLDRLHRDGEISFEQFSAGHMLRHAIMREAQPSVGVSSYGLAVGRADPTTKADRAGLRLTGFMIDLEGRIAWLGAKSRAQQRQLEDAIFAAVGVHDEAGERRVNRQHADILVRLLLWSEQMPTLSSITRELSAFYGATSRKSPAFARGVISVWLSRLAAHFRLVK